MRASAILLLAAGLSGCADSVVPDYHHDNGTTVDVRQLAAARRTCEGVRQQAMARIPDAPTPAKPDDADYGRALRAQLAREAAGRDEAALCMLKQDIHDGKATKPNP